MKKICLNVACLLISFSLRAVGPEEGEVPLVPTRPVTPLVMVGGHPELPRLVRQNAVYPEVPAPRVRLLSKRRSGDDSPHR